MTMTLLLLWLGMALGALVALVIGLRALGGARWAGDGQHPHITQLEFVAALGARGQFPSPARYDVRELERPARPGAVATSVRC